MCVGVYICIYIYIERERDQNHSACTGDTIISTTSDNHKTTSDWVFDTCRQLCVCVK